MSAIGDQFKGLPMQELIGGPLSAAVTANTNLAKATAEFINTVGFNEDKTARMVDFSFERPGIDENGKRTIEVVKIKTPMLAIVPIPNLQVDLVDITFDMEVKSSESSSTKVDANASFEASIGLGPFSAKISGSVSVAKENTRSSDQSAKYHVQVRATNHGIPEGLARVLDMMAAAAAPRDVTSFENKAGELPEGAKDPQKGYKLESGKPVPPVEPTDTKEKEKQE